MKEKNEREWGKKIRKRKWKKEIRKESLWKSTKTKLTSQMSKTQRQLLAYWVLFWMRFAPSGRESKYPEVPHTSSIVLCCEQSARRPMTYTGKHIFYLHEDCRGKNERKMPYDCTLICHRGVFKLVNLFVFSRINSATVQVYRKITLIN